MESWGLCLLLSECVPELPEWIEKENIKLVRGGRRKKGEEEGGEEGDIKHAMFISPTEPLLMTTD